MSGEAAESDEEARELSIETLRTTPVAVAGARRGARFTWFVLHGYGQRVRYFIRKFRGVAGPDRRIVAPEALSRFYLAAPDRPHGTADRVGASWMAREEREAEIRDYLRYLDRLARLSPGDGGEALGAAAGGLTVLGFSQGAHTAARWATLGTVPGATLGTVPGASPGAPLPGARTPRAGDADTRPTRLVLWGAPLPEDLPPAAIERLRTVELIRVRGDGDGTRNPEAEAREDRRLAEWQISSRVIRHPGGHEVVPEVLRELAEAESGSGAS